MRGRKQNLQRGYLKKNIFTNVENNLDSNK